MWLQVGKGAGAEDRLLALMRTLATALREYMIDEGVDAGEVGGGDGESYVKNIVKREDRKCLVVWWPTMCGRKRRACGCS